MSGQGEPGSEAGSSDTAPAQSASEQAVSMLQQNQQQPGTSEPTPSQTQPAQESQPQPTSQQTEQTIGSDFLKGVPDEHRSILEPYVSKWDAGVTRRFQELQSQYAPYRQFVDQGVNPADLNNAVQIYQLLDTNPNYLYQLLKSELEGQEQPGDQGLAPQGGEEEFELPPAVKAQIDQLTQVVEALAQRELTSTQQSKQVQEDQQLESYLALLKTEKGDFDEEYVLARMMKGQSGADAVDAWNAMIQNRLNQAGQGAGTPPVPGSNLPPVLSGGGSVPVTNQNIGTAKDKDVKHLVATMLEHANANNSG